MACEITTCVKWLYQQIWLVSKEPVIDPFEKSVNPPETPNLTSACATHTAARSRRRTLARRILRHALRLHRCWRAEPDTRQHRRQATTGAQTEHPCSKTWTRLVWTPGASPLPQARLARCTEVRRDLYTSEALHDRPCRHTRRTRHGAGLGQALTIGDGKAMGLRRKPASGGQCESAVSALEPESPGRREQRQLVSQGHLPDG